MGLIIVLRKIFGAKPLDALGCCLQKHRSFTFCSLMLGIFLSLSFDLCILNFQFYSSKLLCTFELTNKIRM